MKMIRVSVCLIGLVVALAPLTGCRRKPKIDVGYFNPEGPAGRGDVPGPTYAGGPTTPIGVKLDGEELDNWGDLDGPLAPADGDIIPADRRWTDVVIYFAYDSAAIGPSERPKLEVLSQHLKEHANYSTVVEGHCDERGSDEYNRTLGETRALMVREYLMSLGIEASRMETISYGEEKPVIANSTSESQHQKNRRAEFIIGIRR